MSKETNQIAELNAEMWVMVNPEGNILPHTLDYDQIGCGILYRTYTSDWEAKGYRCIPVSVNIKPIKQFKQ